MISGLTSLLTLAPLLGAGEDSDLLTPGPLDPSDSLGFWKNITELLLIV